LLNISIPKKFIGMGGQQMRVYYARLIHEALTLNNFTTCHAMPCPLKLILTDLSLMHENNLLLYEIQFFLNISLNSKTSRYPVPLT